MSRSKDLRELLNRAVEQVNTVVFGHEVLKESALICLLSGGHFLVESAPGEGKTLFVKALAGVLGLTVDRIQFDAELRPSDIRGFVDRDPMSDEPFFSPGPVFANVVIADEINAAPGKVQNALLQPMQEGAVKVPKWKTENLPTPHFVLATLNPVEGAHGVRFPLPHAQLDRFLLKIKVHYPDLNTLCRIIVHDADAALEQLESVLDRDSLLELMAGVRKQWSSVGPDHPMVRYIGRLAYGIHEYLPQEEYGASSRACNKLWIAANAYAWLKGRSEPGVADIIHNTESGGPLIYRAWAHRMIVKTEARAEELIKQAIKEVHPVESNKGVER